MMQMLPHTAHEADALHDISTLAGHAGYAIPVRVSERVMAGIREAARGSWQDETAHLLEILNRMARTVRRNPEALVYFTVRIEHANVCLYSALEAGPAPSITVRAQGEES